MKVYTGFSHTRMEKQICDCYRFALTRLCNVNAPFVFTHTAKSLSTHKGQRGGLDPAACWRESCQERHLLTLCRRARWRGT